MMRFLKKTILFSLVLALCLCIVPGASALVSQSESFYVADYANVLTESTEQMICDYNGALEKQCQGAQIVVVTVDYLDGMYCDEYAYELFNEWGVGSSEYNNGMLLLLSTQENKAWLAYGLGLSSQLSGSDVDTMLDKHFWKDFDKGRYDEAVTNLFSELLGWYDGVYDSSTAASGESYYKPQQQENHNVYNPFGNLVATAIVFIVVVNVLASGNHRRRGGRSWLPWFLLFNSTNRNNRSYRNNNNRGNWSGGFGGGFGGGSGSGGGGFSGGGGGRR